MSTEQEKQKNGSNDINEGTPKPEIKSPSAISQPDADGVRYYSLPGSRGTYQRPVGEAQKKSTLRNSLIIFGCILLVIVALGVSCNAVTNSFWSGISSIAPGGSYEDSYYLPSSPYIAVVYVEGTIQASGTDMFGAAVGYQHQQTLDTLDELAYDYNNMGLVVFVDSPGGGVYESDQLYLKIKEYQEATGNPVYTAMGSMAASGGYYIAAPSDKIVANRNCWTGSIGVTMGTMYDFSQLLSNFGVKTVTIDSGDNKSVGNPAEPMTAEQQALLQGLVDEAYEQFVGIVAEGRDMTVDQVKPLADGRIYTAKQALDAGLIDEIGTLDEAIADMQETYDLWDCQVTDITYAVDSFWGTIFNKLDSLGQNSQGDVAALVKLMDDGNQFPVSYLCEALK